VLEVMAGAEGGLAVGLDFAGLLRLAGFRRFAVPVAAMMRPSVKSQ
jgi:hypothetical protein